MCMGILPKWMSTIYMSDTCRSQKRALGPLELDGYVVSPMWVLGTELMASAEASVLNHPPSSKSCCLLSLCALRGGWVGTSAVACCTSWAVSPPPHLGFDSEELPCPCLLCLLCHIRCA